MSSILRRTSPLLAVFPLLGTTDPEQAQAQPTIQALDGTGTAIASSSNRLDIASSSTTAAPTLPEAFTPEYSQPDTTGVTQGTEMVLAQAITPATDGTNTNITPDGNQFDISGGTQSGANLFHSFEQFGLDQNQIANFLSDATVKNILGRVVGGDASVIDGLIRVTGGDSNLFLMNPAGIIFGSNASLDIPGSFAATTANGIRIDDDWFKAVGTNNYADLGDTPNTPNAFAFTSKQPGSIFNAGNLKVPQGETITLVGGTVVNTGTFSAPGGNITIAAVPGEKLVRISQEGSLLSLELPVETLPVETKAEIDGDSQPQTPQTLPQLLIDNVDRVTGVAVEDGVVKLTDPDIAIPSEPGTALLSGTLDASNSVLTISGASITAGDISSRSVNLSATDENISAGKIKATENVNLETIQGDITVASIEISFDEGINIEESGLTVKAARLFRVTDTVDKNSQNSILIQGEETDFELTPSQPIISITHGGLPVTLDVEVEGNFSSDDTTPIVINGGNESFGFVVGPNIEGKPLESGYSEFPEGVSGTSGRIFTQITASDGTDMPMLNTISRTFNGGTLGTPIDVPNSNDNGDGNGSDNGGGNASDNSGDFSDSVLTIESEENTAEELKCQPSNTEEFDDNCEFDEADEDEILRYEN